MKPEDRTEYHLAISNADYKMLVDPDEIRAILSEWTEFALDFETTSLTPWDGRIRITSICCDEGHYLIDHDYAGELERYIDCLAGKTLYVYNSKFETLWLDYLKNNCYCIDIDFMAKACIGGSASSLAKMAWRDMQITMDKSWGASDWASPTLSKGQYNYAAFDSYITWHIQKHWAAELDSEKWRGVHILNDATRATIEMEQTGLPLDVSYHRNQIKVWELKRTTFEGYLRGYATHERLKNLRSRIQVGNFIKETFPKEVVEHWPKTPKAQQLQLDRDFMRKAVQVLPYPINRWLSAYIGYTYYDKYISTYGESLVDNYRANGYVKSRFNMAQARTCRYSSSKSNLQNIPRKVTVRKAFSVEDPEKELLVLADYKGVEVRVLAELSGDRALLHDAIYGDVHTTSAALINKVPREEFEVWLTNKGHPMHTRAKGLRSTAKGFTFQLTYGAGEEALSTVLRCSVEDAREAVMAWAQKYNAAYNYRFKMFDIMRSTSFLPSTSGRQMYIFRDDRTLPVASNYPIQGAAADVMYRALYHTYRGKSHLRGVKIGASVHDEIILRSPPHHAEEAHQILVDSMERGWLDIFPNTDTTNLGDSAIGTAWSDKP